MGKNPSSTSQILISTLVTIEAIGSHETVAAVTLDTVASSAFR